MAQSVAGSIAIIVTCIVGAIFSSQFVAALLGAQYADGPQ
jgi:hypothetical protein